MNAGRIIKTIIPITLILTIMMPGILSDTVLTSKVNINNAAPSITTTALDDWEDGDGVDNQIDQMDANDTGINKHRIVCNITVQDNNGCGDINSVKANISGPSGSFLDPDDSDEHYTNTSCTVQSGSCTGGGDNDAIYNCLFRVNYWAEQGTWLCHSSAIDASSDRDNDTDTATMIAVVGYAIDKEGINYDAAVPGVNSSGQGNQNFTVANTGNQQIDWEVSGTDLTSNGDTILHENQSYNFSGLGNGHGGGFSKSPQNGDYVRSTATSYNINLVKRDSTDGDSNDVFIQNDTAYFVINIPYGTAVGTYSGTLTITGISG